MVWEQRGTRRYYYRAHKIGGRVVKEYLGGGLIGLLAARDDEDRRRERDEAREQLRRAQEAFATAVAPLHELSRLADALMVAALVDAGFHRHDRGEWRKRRAHTDR